jgi:chemotaxis protein MotB
MARRNKRHAEHENHERWLITYADLITLLLIFFVIMYAMSKIDMSKYTVLAQSLQYQFKKSDTVMPHGGGSGYVGVIDPIKTTSEEDKNNKQMSDEEKKKLEQQQAQVEKREKELQDLMKAITVYVNEQGLQGQISIKDTPRGVAITLNDLFLFDLGKADLKAGASPILGKMASLFLTLHTQVSIEGHTDNLAVNPGSPFKDNWRLSSERSLSVLRYFTNESKLPENTFISVAYADTKPVAANDSDANRQKNRRVEIIVLR